LALSERVVTDSDQGLYLFIMPEDTMVYSFYTPAGYSCGYRINTSTLMESVIVEASDEDASVNAYPGLIDSSLCR